MRRKRPLLVVATAGILLFLIWHLYGSSSEWVRDGSSSEYGLGHKDEGEPLKELEEGLSHRPSKPGKGHIINQIASFIPLPTAIQDLPRIQYDFKPESGPARESRLARLEAIKAAMMHSWKGYRQRAWLKDELAPVTGGYRSTFGDWSLTLVDTLDTLWLMGFKNDFEAAVHAVAGIDFNTATQLPINVFETTIRHLGGLLGAYDVSNRQYPTLLDKAIELGEMLYGAFDTPNHMPVTKWSKIGVEGASGHTLVAELGTLSLEFTRLTQLTGDPKYYDAVQRISDCLGSQQNYTRAPGLFPHIVNARECWFGDGVTFSIGGSADSVYEYFPKEYQLLGGANEQYKRLFEIAKDPMKKFILFKPMTPTNEDILMAGTLKSFRPGHTELIPQTQHLACFAGGMFALAAKLFSSPEDLETADRLVHGCIWAYKQTATAIMPEMFHLISCPADDRQCKWDDKAWHKHMLLLNSHDETPQDKLLPEGERFRKKSQRLRLPKGIAAIANRAYELRPEAVESIFVLYRVTGDESLRESAWEMFEAITKYTRTEFGYSCIEDVTLSDPRKTDKMESFWTAETLKYFWLLFEDPNVVSLDDFVLNTEAHPFRLPKKR
ncbi:uncharacterized protein A1O5_02003 [Cladophialophora psammophila CBS 110553]|uniref:alpha-1,2-Mannosidase n=1 Tax=Cladophialophora psammophila CBS 110553 TaxID=1182543 RepID=W9X496_9EURO|nr:uncharacterized protein A1O5_02003 [Cladophialophora psammophila CBS 110553]EXJ75307.1 hypothetical protein A1O5_02003 [Cladophialophora psammophila CBS 110553]